MDSTLVRDVSPGHMLSQTDLAMIESLSADQVVSVHVRRSDYLLFPEFRLDSGETYLAQAMARIKAGHPQARFLVFSDDIAWCRSSPLFAGRCDFYDAPPDRNPMLDLYIMSRCSHHIISNSSYSWWAAWLGDCPGKQIIAPSTWIFGADSRKTGMIPDHWTTIP